ncbi:MAG: VanW family protein [Candidatus Pacebacteria bacterium]|nr:VanW family protein [Candidatus Paceibacterota bacterium]
MERFRQPIKFVFSQNSKKKGSQAVFIEEKLNPFNQKPKKTNYLAGVSLITVILTALLFIVYSSSKFLPETYVEEVRIGGLTKEEAVQKITNQYPTPPEHTITLGFDSQQFLEQQAETISNFTNESLNVTTNSAELAASYDYQTTINDILTNQQKNKLDWLKQLIFEPNKQKLFVLPIKYDSDKLKLFVQNFKNKFDQPLDLPSVSLEITNSPQSLVLNPGSNTLAIKLDKTLEKITTELRETSHLTNIKKRPILSLEPELVWASKTLTPEEKVTALKTAQQLVGTELTLKYDVITKKINDQQLVSFLTFPTGFIDEKLDELIDSWKEELDRPAQNAEFEFDKQSFVVTKFFPDREGLALDKDQLKTLLKETINNLMINNQEKTKELTLPFVTTTPDLTLEKTNNLGINQRIGFGESYYAHSIPSRIHNVALAAERINYSIVAPGKEFSFNKAIGDVSAQTGFQSAYVIKDGQTVLGDGGGVCQVSTTLFRALLNGGLDITLRLPHSYRVSYYELDNQPGFDATVYDGNVDLRFINDTPNYILIYTETDSNNLYMKVELYGTSDGRTAEISNYKSWGYSPPLPPVYVPDPSLPTGKLKQIDWSASGIKAEFTYTVKDKNGEIIREKTYYSNYRPWAAKYLQGI